MALTIGRQSIRTATRKDGRRIPAEQPSLGGPHYEREFRLTGRERGSTVETIVEQLHKDAERGEGGPNDAVYAEDADSIIEAGYYRIAAFGYERAGGSPQMRRWEVTLISKHFPRILRPAHSDNVAGVDTADLDVLNGEKKKVVYTPTTAEVVVLQPRTVAGAEKFNLPAAKSSAGPSRTSPVPTWRGARAPRKRLPLRARGRCSTWATSPSPRPVTRPIGRSCASRASRPS
jgi:hypothetical protein